jgi:hypothetical protein
MLERSTGGEVFSFFHDFLDRDHCCALGAPGEKARVSSRGREKNAVDCGEKVRHRLSTVILKPFAALGCLGVPMNISLEGIDKPMSNFAVSN